MPHYGNCCVCALTLCLCVLGSMSTSMGVCLYLNYELFGVNSTTTRTFPGGEWRKTAGLTTGAVGVVMFTSGLFIVLCCLTSGVPEKCKRHTGDKYNVFHNESDEDLENPHHGAKSDVASPITGVEPSVTTNSTYATSESAIDFAYDVPFCVEDKVDLEKISEETAEQVNASDGRLKPDVCKPCDRNDPEGGINRAVNKAKEPLIEYPIVNLECTLKPDHPGVGTDSTVLF